MPHGHHDGRKIVGFLTIQFSPTGLRKAWLPNSHSHQLPTLCGRVSREGYMKMEKFEIHKNNIVMRHGGGHIDDDDTGATAHFRIRHIQTNLQVADGDSGRSYHSGQNPFQNKNVTTSWNENEMSLAIVVMEYMGIFVY
jgi:hypothetical protein